MTLFSLWPSMNLRRMNKCKVDEVSPQPLSRAIEISNQCSSAPVSNVPNSRLWSLVLAPWYLLVVTSSFAFTSFLWFGKRFLNISNFPSGFLQLSAGARSTKTRASWRHPTTRMTTDPTRTAFGRSLLKRATPWRWSSSPLRYIQRIICKNRL